MIYLTPFFWYVMERLDEECYASLHSNKKVITPTECI
nr:MAG TPA: hypothetical protein [Caudoviricetes sp.]